jgi:hypothetical protein
MNFAAKHFVIKQFTKNFVRIQERIIRSWITYNAKVVKIYNATGSLVRFENKNIVFYFEKMF